MKKVISMIKILLPGLLVLWLIFALRGGVDILAGLFIFFPVLYILFGVACSKPVELLIGILLTDLAFLLPINLCFHMGTCLGYALVYSSLGAGAFFIKRKIQQRHKQK